VHDTISQKDYNPKLPEIPYDAVDEEEETVKIVQLVKSNEPMVSFCSSFQLTFIFFNNEIKNLFLNLISRFLRLKQPNRLWYYAMEMVQHNFVINKT